MARVAPWLAVLLTACGGTAAPQPSHPLPAAESAAHGATTAPEDGASLDGPFDAATPSPPYAFHVSIPRPNGQVEYFEMSAGGELVRWVSPYERPEPPARIVMRSDFALWDTVNDEVTFALHEDGALLPTRYEPDMRCSALRDGRVRCRCSGHTPILDVTYSIAGDELLGSTASVTEPFGHVTPPPSNAAERLRVLVVIAEWTYSLDDHGDSAHDIDH